MSGKVVDATLRFVDRFTKPMGAATRSLEAHSKQYKRMGREIQSSGRNIEKTGQSMTAKATLPIAALGAGALKTAANFEKGMSKVQSISGASQKDISMLSNKAKEMGAKTKFSATEAADAFSYMAMAGWDTQQMMSGIEGTMYLAGASGEDLASTSDIVTDALTAFGLQAKDTNRFVDVMAQTANRSNTNVGMMGKTFQYVAPAAGALQYSVEDTSVAIGLMANQGIKADKAGTSLKNLFVNLAKPTDAMAGTMERLGVSLTDSHGKMKPFNQVMLDMRKGFAKLTPEQKASEAATLAGKEGMAGLLAIVNSSDKDFNKLSKAINNSNGAAKKMYDTANDNFIGRLTILKSTVESIGISMGDKLLPYAEKAVKGLQNLSEKFNSLSPAMQDKIIKFAGMAAAIGPATFAFGKMTTGVGKTIERLGDFGKSLPELKGRAKAAGEILKTIKMPHLSMPKGITKVFTSLSGKVKILTGPLNNLGNAVFTNVAAKAKTVIGPIGNVGGKMLTVAKNTKIYSAAMAIGGKMSSGFAKAGGLMLAPFKKVVSAFGTVGKSMFTFLGPAGTVIAILGAIVIAGILVYKNWDKIKAAAKSLGKTIQSAFKASGIDIVKMGKRIDGMRKDAAKAFKAVGKAGKGLWKALKPIAKSIGGFFSKTIKVAFHGIVGAASGLLNGIVEVASGITKAFGGIITFVTGVFSGDWKKAWIGVKDIFKGIFSSLAGILKTPINAVIGLINSAMSSINKLGIDIPKWVPGIGGKSWHPKIPKIPMLYKGTMDWKGGPAMIHDRGAEIVDLPRGSRVYPHEKSIQMAKESGQKRIEIEIKKIADQIVVREDADIDKIIDKLVKRLEELELNMA